MNLNRARRVKVPLLTERVRKRRAYALYKCRRALYAGEKNMKRMKMVGLLVCIAACLSGRTMASAASKDPVVPSPGMALVSTSLGEVKKIDGKSVAWKAGSQHEIAAGEHTLLVQHFKELISSGTEITYRFEEGKSYFISVEFFDIEGETGGFSLYVDIADLSVTPQQQIELPPKTDLWPGSVSFSPDGSMVVISNNKSVEIYGVKSGALVKQLKGHAAMVRACTWSPDGTKIISGDGKGIIKIWDASSGAEIKSITGKGYVSRLKVTPDGTKIIGNRVNGVSPMQPITAWDINSGVELFSIKNNLRDAVNGREIPFAVSRDGKYFAAMFETGKSTQRRRMQVYSMDDQKQIYESENTVRPLAFIDSNTLITYYNGTKELALLNIPSNTSTRIQQKDSFIQSADLSFDGKKIILFCGGARNFVRIVDVGTGNTDLTFSIASSSNYLPYILATAVSPVENKLAVLGKNKIYFFDF